MDDADWSLIPEHMRGAMFRYIEHGLAPGDFLTAVLRNDLKESYLRADSINQQCLLNYVKFLYLSAPHNCWGSRENFNEWVAHRGLEGLNEVTAPSDTSGA